MAILGVGTTAAALHALWNSMGLVSGLLLAIVGVLSHAFDGCDFEGAPPTRTQTLPHFLERSGSLSALSLPKA